MIEIQIINHKRNITDPIQLHQTLWVLSGTSRWTAFACSEYYSASPPLLSVTKYVRAQPSAATTVYATCVPSQESRVVTAQILPLLTQIHVHT